MMAIPKPTARPRVPIKASSRAATSTSAFAISTTSFSTPARVGSWSVATRLVMFAIASAEPPSTAAIASCAKPCRQAWVAVVNAFKASVMPGYSNMTAAICRTRSSRRVSVWTASS